MKAFLKALFQSPANRHAETVKVFRERGLIDYDANRAATELWLACRAGRRTPQWILDALKQEVSE